MKRIKIIEFAGLTGCGKSTLCRELIKCIDKGRIIQYRDVFAKHRIKALFIPLLLIVKDFRQYSRALDIFALEYSQVSKDAINKLKVLFIYAMTRKKTSIIILDEGFVQLITSVAHLEPIAVNNNLIELTRILNSAFDISLIKCVIDKEIALTRLRGRNSGDRFNAIKDDSDLLKAFEIKQNNINVVSSLFPNCTEIEMNRSNEELCVELLNIFLNNTERQVL